MNVNHDEEPGPQDLLQNRTGGLVWRSGQADKQKKKYGLSLKESGKLYNDERSEYIKLHTKSDDYDGLHYSAKLRFDNILVRVVGDSKLLTVSDKFIALVTIARITDLDNATVFNHAKDLFQQHLQIVQHIRNVDLENFEAVQENLKTWMEKLGNNSLENVQNAEDLYQLYKIFKPSQNKFTLVKAINANENISSETKQVVLKYVELFNDFHKGEGFLKNLISKSIDESNDLKVSAELSSALQHTVMQGIETHRSKSLEESPSTVKKSIAKLEGGPVLFITREDLKFVSHIKGALNDTIFKSFQPFLTSQYIFLLENMKTDKLLEKVPLTNHVYIYLCKSVSDVLQVINEKTIDDLEIGHSSNEWIICNTLQWKTPPSMLENCLLRELEMLLEMVNHFELGKPSTREQFRYEFKIFANINKSNPQLPTDVHVWLCLLDDTIDHVLARDRQIDRLCSSLLPLYTNFAASESSAKDSIESLRVMTHNIVKFLALTGPFIKESKSKLELDEKILQRQIDSIGRATLGSVVSFSDCRDMVEVYVQYWNRRDRFAADITDKLSNEIFNPHCNEIQTILLQLINDALEKQIELPELINFFRAYDELLGDLLDLNFDWYVRVDNSYVIQKGLLELVKNKLQDSDNKCYRVVNISRFVEAFPDEHKLPRHYLLDILKILLNCINNMMTKIRWNGGEKLTELEKVKSTALMISSVRSCLLYLNEQPDYANFDQYLGENSRPFMAVSKECTSFEDFKKRVLLIKESFWYIRNLNAINIDTALKLFKKDNHGIYSEELLQSAHVRYEKQFEKYMGQNSTNNVEEKILAITKEVKQIVTDHLTPKWDSDFKQQILPEILAAIGSVWAMYTSKDVASTGQYLKPHCIQVLGVLRLLSVDSPNQGVQKHLAQILTGQGKSLVLGMTAAALALCGHSVVIMCYSEYLATRDQQDFEELYKFFSVQAKIEYKTFRQAAREEINRVSGNASQYIHGCLGLSDAEKRATKLPPNPVVLIDEVDVFFDENLFGESLNIVAVPSIPGLGAVQIEIWKQIQGGIDTDRIYQSIEAFINNNNNSDEIKQFQAFRNKTKFYALLENDEKKTNNFQLVKRELQKMINMAIRAKEMPTSEISKTYRLNENGNIMTKTSFGVFCESNLEGYMNTFMYFRLKESNFEKNNGNYGYLIIPMGSISYAKLPECYPLILGVTGTLTTLSDYEKKVVKEYYQIHESSVMPSFFGASNLQFNKRYDVNCFKSRSDWMNAIFSRINAILNSMRSVLVIFDAEETVDAFMHHFADQLDRLNILTINTDLDKKEKYITESGVAKTITLTTREMGRGVDYKTSVAVEKNGGVHVIQTFFSLDIKEETQIKGRTARKDNRGSYEMILCYEHLSKLDLPIGSSKSDVTYKKLCGARDSLNKELYSRRDAHVQAANAKQRAMIDFYKGVKFKGFF